MTSDDSGLLGSTVINFLYPLVPVGPYEKELMYLIVTVRPGTT